MFLLFSFVCDIVQELIHMTLQVLSKGADGGREGERKGEYEGGKEREGMSDFSASFRSVTNSSVAAVDSSWTVVPVLLKLRWTCIQPQ